MENNSIKKALIIDDEPDICQLAEITLNRMGLETRSANDINTGKKLLQSESFDLCLTDMNLPDGDGIDLVSYISDNFPNMPVAVITAYGNMESAVRALKAGAFDFVSKPVDLQILRNLISSAIKLPRETAELFNPETTKSQILGNSAVIQNLRQKISKLARSQAPVFIHGESGCGKELAARLIHEQGARAENPFIAINCGAIPSELMESEFFGHKKGSFTGAASDKEGLFMAANQGTLFLDEVADLPLHMQVKLLRAIQEKAIRPVGEHEEKPVDVRILSASHKNLAELVKQGKFREDLFYRINVIELEVASLKDRTEDIPVLADFFLQQLSQQSGL
ncbi:MAG: sigma-54 dependent transcriptional regulator, partial [Gammaproteobacteria bacterium]|nr:sigma-54 dependent transcriptional regulator [Gammaproteobacteria bacterium]